MNIFIYIYAMYRVCVCICPFFLNAYIYIYTYIHIHALSFSLYHHWEERHRPYKLSLCPEFLNKLTWTYPDFDQIGCSFFSSAFWKDLVLLWALLCHAPFARALGLSIEFRGFRLYRFHCFFFFFVRQISIPQNLIFKVPRGVSRRTPVRLVWSNLGNRQK